MIRIGSGYDSHRLEEGYPLILGGVALPSSKGSVAHSDGDALTHALIDALLGALALGDIGSHYPPSEKRWKNATGETLLTPVVKLITQKKWHIVNVDSTIILETPKLRPHINDMRNFYAKILTLPVDCISIKAKTAEKMGEVGKGNGVEAHVTVLLQRS